MKNYWKEHFFNDFLASFVVFLVALPLCLGIAIASGVDPIYGLISGVIGGLVVGTFSGSPLQVSGPAAGLAVMVFQFVERFGLQALIPLGIIIGLVQITMYKFKFAQYFRAISPALIKGMLSGIGLLIIIGQIYVAVEAKPGGNGLKNILGLPATLIQNLITANVGMMSLIVTLFTIGLIFSWSKLFPKLNKKFPAPLIAIIVASAVSVMGAFEISFVAIPKDLMNELNLVSLNSFAGLSLSLIFSAIAIAFVASAESLLCANAVDKLTKTQSDYNKEIFAQGLGNMIAGFVGALPLTGVIVRSSANLESGGKTRGSAIMHGVWLFCLVFFCPQVLELVPIPALAGILIFTGVKLLNIGAIPKMVRDNKQDAAIFGVTLALIVGVDLLTGVVAGFVFSLMILTYNVVKLEVQYTDEENEVTIQCFGKATFLHIPKITESLDRVRADKKVVLDFRNIQYLDSAIKEEVENWAEKVNEKSETAVIHYPALGKVANQ